MEFFQTANEHCQHCCCVMTVPVLEAKNFERTWVYLEQRGHLKDVGNKARDVAQRRATCYKEIVQSPTCSSPSTRQESVTIFQSFLISAWLPQGRRSSVASTDQEKLWMRRNRHFLVAWILDPRLQLFKYSQVLGTSVCEWTHRFLISLQVGRGNL